MKTPLSHLYLAKKESDDHQPKRIINSYMFCKRNRKEFICQGIIVSDNKSMLWV
jgi:hypothetical protein